MIGKLIKFSSKKTILVKCFFLLKKKKYNKYIKIYRKFLIHYSFSFLKLGDKLIFKINKPISKRKFFKFIRIIK
ncbi:30S ribosomal protein S17 [Candidatus Vidania fulgoroideorum]